MNAARHGSVLAAGVAAAATAAALALTTLGGCTMATPSSAAPHQGHAAAGGTATAFQREMDISMMRMMQDMHAPGYSGDADTDFLAMMIPHHAGAVDMARLVLQHGRDPVTRRLAEDIIAGQTTEIEGMTRRLAALRQVGAAGRIDEYPSLGGTRGP